MIAINERSFVAQASDLYEVSDRMRHLMEVIARLQPALNGRPIVAHTRLYEVMLTGEVNFYSWVHMSLGTDRDLQLSFIIYVKNGPFIDDEVRALGIDCSCCCELEDISSSAVASMAHLGGVAVSWLDAGAMSQHEINVKLCADDSEVMVKNYSTLEQVTLIERVYAPTEKHEAHGWGTPMDLSFEDGERTLKTGVMVGGSVFGKCNGSYYIFRSDNVGGFHGYPIPIFDVPNEARIQLDSEGSN